MDLRALGQIPKIQGSEDSWAEPTEPIDRQIEEEDFLVLKD